MHGLSGFAYVWLHVYVRLRVEVKNHPLLLFYLIHQGRVSQTNSELTGKANLASQLALENCPPPPFLPSEAGITGGLPCPPTQHVHGFLGSYSYTRDPNSGPCICIVSTFCC